MGKEEERRLRGSRRGSGERANRAVGVNGGC